MFGGFAHGGTVSEAVFDMTRLCIQTWRPRVDQRRREETHRVAPTPAGPACYRGRDPSKLDVYEDVLPASAAGISLSYPYPLYQEAAT
jgi:uncharacterized glyoxalase superfamily metalloenzyme YdcJ